jgi:DUF4097 and DUF4098 domain-containing protein YvlB
MSRILIGAGLFASLVLASCINLGDLERARADFHYSYALEPGGRLDLHNTNGSVDIAGWDRNTIEVSGTKFASSEDRLREISIRVSASGNEASVQTEEPRDFLHGSYSVRYVIRVPSRISLGQVHTTNGAISIEDLDGGGQLSGTNGHISLARDTGDYNVQTTNGQIDIEECSGSERAGTTNGSIRGRLKTGALQAHSTNGSIDFTIVKPIDGQPIRVSTVNGGITLTLAEFHDNAITATTTHGSVTLRLPSDTNARLSASSALSRISSSFTLASTVDISRHRFEGQLGSGGPLISASTTTGSIHLERY